jgi:hypothetical protein
MSTGTLAARGQLPTWAVCAPIEQAAEEMAHGTYGCDRGHAEQTVGFRLCTPEPVNDPLQTAVAISVPDPRGCRP